MSQPSSLHKHRADLLIAAAIQRVFGLVPNHLRLLVDRVRIKRRYSSSAPNASQMRLHLGCGRQHLDGFLNIDVRKTPATDYVCDIRNLPFADQSVERIESYHVIEHLARNDADSTLREWHRVLTQGGALVIECPDFDRAVADYLAGDESRLDSIYGLQRYPGDAHLWGYSSGRLKRALTAIGFHEIVEAEPQDYHAKKEPCLRIQAIKR